MTADGLIFNPLIIRLALTAGSFFEKLCKRVFAGGFALCSQRGFHT